MVVAASTIWPQTVSHFRRCGAGRRECVTYWIGPSDDPTLADEAVHPVHRASAGSYELDERWLHEFWVGLRRRKRSVRVQLHTHAFGAFHSRTDDLWPIVHVPGFISVVVPNFATAFSLDEVYVAVINKDGVWRRAALGKTLRGLR